MSHNNVTVLQHRISTRVFHHEMMITTIRLFIFAQGARGERGAKGPTGKPGEKVNLKLSANTL